MHTARACCTSQSRPPHSRHAPTKVLGRTAGSEEYDPRTLRRPDFPAPDPGDYTTHARPPRTKLCRAICFTLPVLAIDRVQLRRGSGGGSTAGTSRRWLSTTAAAMSLSLL